MEEAFVYVIVAFIAVSFSSFNIFTLSIIFLNKKLRSRISNFPIVSFLVASALQGLIAAPVYVYRQMIHDEFTKMWTCNVYRFPYIFCGHLMKISLMLVSFDRMAAVKYPFKYKEVSCYMILTLILVWLITAVVDAIPFIHGAIGNLECSYIPTKYWGVSVLVVYDFLPFLIIVVNYSIVWSLAAKFSFQDRNREESLRKSREHLNATDAFVYSDNDLLLSKRATSYGSLNGQLSSSPRNKTISNIRHLLDIRATKTSLVLLAVYLICWGPSGLFYTIDHFCSGCLSSNDGTRMARIIIKLLNFSSSVVAPIAYCWWNKEYRKTAKQVSRKLRCCCCFDGGYNNQARKRSPSYRSIDNSRHRLRKSQLTKIEETKLTE